MEEYQYDGIIKHMIANSKATPANKKNTLLNRLNEISKKAYNISPIGVRKLNNPFE